MPETWKFRSNINVCFCFKFYLLVLKIKSIEACKSVSAVAGLLHFVTKWLGVLLSFNNSIILARIVTKSQSSDSDKCEESINDDNDLTYKPLEKKRRGK